MQTIRIQTHFKPDTQKGSDGTKFGRSFNRARSNRYNDLSFSEHSKVKSSDRSRKTFTAISVLPCALTWFLKIGLYQFYWNNITRVPNSSYRAELHKNTHIYVRVCVYGGVCNFLNCLRKVPSIYLMKFLGI